MINCNAMYRRFFFQLFFTLLVSFGLSAQSPSIPRPRICHDAMKKLACITEGNNIFMFPGGNFTGFRSVDGVLWYEDATRTITFVRPYYGDIVTYDTTSLTLQKKSVLLRNKGSVIELTDLEHLSLAIKALSVIAYSDNQGSGLALHLADGTIKLPIRRQRKGYVWDVEVLRGTESVFLRSGEGNYTRMISCSDDLIKRGIVMELRGAANNTVNTVQDGYAPSLSISSGLKHSLARGNDEESYQYWYGKDGSVKGAIHGIFISCSCQ